MIKNIDNEQESAGNKVKMIKEIPIAILYVVIVVLTFFFKQQVTFYAVSSIYWMHYLVESYTKYRADKMKKELIPVISFLIASVAFTVAFLVTILI